MSNPVLGQGAVARAVLVSAIACVYAGAVLINNNLLFPWLQFDSFRNLMFLPAGLKLFLVMLFGWRAVMGIALGITATALAEFHHVSMTSALLLGAMAALSTQLALLLMSRVLGVRFPWADMGWLKLCAIALVVGCLDALTVQSAMALLGYETFENFVSDTLQGAFGRVAGTFVFLSMALEVRRRLAATPQP